MNIAIVTGASSGLGREYVQLLDEQSVDEIWLISRRQEKLEETAYALKTKSRILPLDLQDPASYTSFAAALRQEKTYMMPDMAVWAGLLL